MQDRSRAIDLVNASMEEAVGRGLAQLQAEDESLDGRSIRVGGRRLINFASCSYLGLELDPRVRAAAIEAVQRYGTQFSCSRAYLSAPLTQELESTLDRVFEAHTLVTPNTTLAHFTALPLLIEPVDAVILDHQVHHTVHLAMAQVRLQGSPVEIVRHGRLDQLEERIRELSGEHARVWYLADGVYSMYGDLAPMKAIAWLLEQHESLHVYLDDAHGMSWTGTHGRGHAAEALRGHERAVVAVSLNKGFGAGGGALVFPDARLRRRVRNVGAPLMFTGPLQPPMLGAALASARIHLSPEIEQLQADLLARVRLVNRTSRELDLPLASTCEVPIRYVGLGVQAAAFDMVERLLARGYCMNPAAFPAVGSRNAGVRFTVTLHHGPEDIGAALTAIAEELPGVLARADTCREDVDRAFGLAPPPRRSSRSTPRALALEHAPSIRALDAAEWNACLGSRGCFDADSLAALEDVFGDGERPEHRWRFHYWVVRGANGRPVLATFFTEALWKDDLLAAAAVSRAVERRREKDPYLLSSRVLAMGSLLTEGDHLHLDRDADWRGALTLLLGALREERDECEAPALVLRDLRPDDEELQEVLREAGFFAVKLPESQVIEIDWSSREEFLARRSKRERRFHAERVLPFEAAWELEILGADGRRPDAAEWEHLYRLYGDVQRRQLALNTFPLPEALLPRLARCPGWEILLLRLRPEHGGDPDAPAQGFVACHAGPEAYTPLLVGMDYRCVESHGLYRQLLAQSVWRAQQRGARRVAFGMGSELEKRRFGARPVERVMWVQSHDRFHQDVLELIASTERLGRGD